MGNRLSHLPHKTGLFILCLLASQLMRAGGVPSNVVEQLSARLPVALVPFPAKGANKLMPIESEKRASYDRTTLISIRGALFALTAFSEDRKSVEMVVPVKAGSSEYHRRWFKVDDVFGGVLKWRLESYVTPSQVLCYNRVDARTVDLIASLDEGTKTASLAQVPVGKTMYRLAQFRGGDVTVGDVVCTFRLALIRETPPVKTPADYKKRAAEFRAEYAYREARAWSNDQRSLLTDEMSFGCAGFCADFARYMFGGGLLSRRGSEFKSVAEIRDGDILHIDHHYFVVVSRKGNTLVTAEGNMNAATSHSDRRYSISGDKVLFNGADAKFDYGLHNWNPAR